MRRRPMQKSMFRSRLAGTLLVTMIGLAVVVPSSAADPALPSISYSVDGIAGNNSWYRGSTHGNNIVLHWSVTGATSVPIGECQPAITFPGPNTGFTQTCSATNDVGTVSVTTKVLKIDADPPAGVSANFARGADFNGWYNHPVGVTWQGSDATSGIASCGASTYGGPDAAGNAVGGSCIDKAGNTASSSIAINYDATAPVLGKVRIDSKASSNQVHWASTSPSDTVVVQRWARGNDKQQAVLFRGSGTAFADGKVAPGLEYNYAVQTFDQAGNASKRIVVAGLPKVLLLGKTGYVPRAAAKPILRWNRVHGAQYYNVQLYRGAKRVFAAWPAKNQLGLPAGWRWNGKRQRLSPGKYRWYVWAGFGARSFAHYQTVGSAQFIVPR